MKKLKIKLYLVAVVLLFASSITNILSAQCDPADDVTPPTVNCFDQTIQLAAGQSLTIDALDLVDGIWDDCTPESELIINMTESSNPGVIISDFLIPAGTNGSFVFTIEVIDLAGNTTTCTSLVIVVSIPAVCTPDIVAPVAVCDAWIQLTTSTTDITLTALEVDDGSWDNCSTQPELQFFLGTDINGPLPSTTSVNYPAGYNGLDTVILWVVDAAGNFNSCLTVVSIGDCDPNIPLPTAICNADIVIPYSPGDYIFDAFDVLEGVYDSCTIASFNFTIAIEDGSLPPPIGSPTITLPADTFGIFNVLVFITDNLGNVNTCWTQITIEPNPALCNDDTIDPVAICDLSYAVTSMAGEPINLPAVLFDDGSYDNCTTNLEYYATLDANLTSPPNTDTLTFPPNTNGTYIVYFWVVDEAGNASVCETIIEVETFHIVAGSVFADDNDNCMLESDEIRLENITVRYTLDQGLTYETTTTDENGNYGFSISGFTQSTEITLEVVLPTGLSSNCPTSYTEQFPLGINPYFVDFPIQLASDCDNMTVDVAAPFLRRCFPTPYTVTYCNNSAYDIDDAEILVTLPQEMVIDNVDEPYSQPSGNQLLFDVGTVASGSCSNIVITVILDCNVPLGATKCVQAEITPNDCQQPDMNWSGASLEVSANCNEDTERVEFTITNTGTGTMTDAREYIIIEDVIMYMQNPDSIGSRWN